MGSSCFCLCEFSFVYFLGPSRPFQESTDISTAKNTAKSTTKSPAKSTHVMKQGDLESTLQEEGPEMARPPRSSPALMQDDHTQRQWEGVRRNR